LKIISCPGAECFTNKVLRHLHKKHEEFSKSQINPANFLCDIKPQVSYTYFANGEMKCKILESIREKNVYIFQDFANQQPILMNNNKIKVILSVNDLLMQLFITIDAVRHASAGTITLVIPTFPYARQHKKTGREGLTASLLCQMFERLGVSRIITLDIHSQEIENAFHKAVLENLYPGYQVIKQLLQTTEINTEEFIVVSPDTGAVARNKFYANKLQVPLAMLYKERDYSRVSISSQNSNITEMKLLGNVKGKICFIVDDMCSGGGTSLRAFKVLKENGAKEIYAAFSLPFFIGDAIGEFSKLYKEGIFNKIFGTSAVYNPKLWEQEWFELVEIESLFAEVINCMDNNISISEIIEGTSKISEILNKTAKMTFSEIK
jgi:ribose-phosphate pyrophosphokinase